MVNLAKGSFASKAQKTPKTYFQLIEKVGSKGKYQRVIFFIFCLNWFITSMLIMQSVFLFLNPTLDCLKNGLVGKPCEAYFCQISDKDIRQTYIDTQSQIKSISTLYGPYYCQDSFTVSILQSVMFVGIFFGYIFFMYFTDNYGRKVGIVMAWTVATVGLGILCASAHLSMAVIGLFLAGAGSQSAIRISMAVLGEVVDYNVRQQYSIALEIAFGSGSVLVPILYYLIGDWRIINIIFILGPAIVLELLFLFYFEQTPKYLFRKGVNKTLKSLNRIGQINTGRKQILIQRDIISVMQQQVQDDDKFNKVITPIDLFRFQSMRLKSIGVLTLFFLITTIYFGPVFIVQQLGFNIYLSQIIVGASQLISYPIAYFYVQRLSRQKTGVICFTIVTFFLGVLVFLEKPEDCDNCIESIIEIICVFFARFTVSFYFSLFFLYATELFPLRARAMGFGIGSAAGAIGSSSAPIIFGFLIGLSINPMLYLALCSILGIAVLLFLPQTMNKPLQVQIQEIQQQKNLIKQKRSASQYMSKVSTIKP